MSVERAVFGPREWSWAAPDVKDLIEKAAERVNQRVARTTNSRDVLRKTSSKKG